MNPSNPLWDCSAENLEIISEFSSRYRFGIHPKKKRYHSGITSEILSDIPLRLFWTSFWIFLQNSVCDFACISLRITFEIQEIKFFEILENCFRNTMEDFTINPDAIHLDI